MECHDGTETPRPTLGNLALQEAYDLDIIDEVGWLPNLLPPDDATDQRAPHLETKAACIWCVENVPALS